MSRSLSNCRRQTTEPVFRSTLPPSSGRLAIGIQNAWFWSRNHWLWYIMEKVDEWIERSVGPTTVAHVLLAFRLTMASISPPLTRRLAGLRDHRIHQRQHCDWRLFAHERQRESGQRLSDENHAFWIPIADRADDGSSVLRKTGPVIRRRQFYRDSLMTALLQLRRDQVPVPCAPAGARN